MFPHYISYNLLFAELLGIDFNILNLPYLLFPIIILLTIYQISKHFFKGSKVYIPVAVFVFSPWFWYLFYSHSLYILTLLLTLSLSEGVILVTKGKGIPGNIYLTLSSLILMYVSSIFLILVPIIILGLLFTKLLKLKEIKISLIAITLLILPLLFIISNNGSVIIHKFKNEVAIFKDPGLANSINRYQGAAQDAGYKILSRVSENKYLFYTEYFTYKYIAQFVPGTYLTSQYKLLGFSQSPPIFLGFLFPLAYGLYRLLANQKARKILLVTTVLAVPSILGNDIVSLNRLILFFPILVFIISHGLIFLSNNRSTKLLLYLTLALVFIQLLLTVYDIKTHESIRSKVYLGGQFEQVEP